MRFSAEGPQEDPGTSSLAASIEAAEADERVFVAFSWCILARAHARAHMHAFRCRIFFCACACACALTFPLARQTVCVCLCVCVCVCVYGRAHVGSPSCNPCAGPFLFCEQNPAGHRGRWVWRDDDGGQHGQQKEAQEARGPRGRRMIDSAPQSAPSAASSSFLDRILHSVF